MEKMTIEETRRKLKRAFIILKRETKKMNNEQFSKAFSNSLSDAYYHGFEDCKNQIIFLIKHYQSVDSDETRVEFLKRFEKLVELIKTPIDKFSNKNA